LVSTGSGCVLNLTYTPVAGDSGTLTVNYIFINNANIPESPGGSVSIPYAASASAANDVIATVSPNGQIDAALGHGSQSVSINFTTDTGYAATGLALTSALSTLPAGWSSTANDFSCAIVSEGNGCQLLLTYAPTAAASGRTPPLVLGYSYTDTSGAARTGAVNIPYATTSSANVVATTAPSGQVNAIEKTGSQAVAVTFTTDDGKTASNLFLTDVSTLPAGWTGNLAAFKCASVSTGNGCQLQLKYAPAALTAGTLTVGYGYTNDAGTAETGTLDVTYAATTNDNVTGTASPSGPINEVVGVTAPATVLVTFTTDDNRPATALTITNDLTMLPAGWSSPVDSFACAGLSTGTGCQLSLGYAPLAYGNGTLMLNYSYKNNAGLTKTGSVTIPYSARTDDSIVATPSSASLAVFAGSSNPVTVVFTTNDGNPQSALAVSGLASLPAGWSAAGGTFGCANINVNTSCELALVYAPTAAASDTLTLSYTYKNDAGSPDTGTVSIAYVSTVPPYLYVANASGTISSCVINTDGSLLPCVVAGSGFAVPQGIAIAGGELYVANSGSNALSECALGIGGILGDCAVTGSAPSGPAFVAVNPAGTTAYINQSTGLSACAIAPGGGAVGPCIAASASINPLVGIALSPDGTHAYSVSTGTPNVIEVCTVANTGALTNCAATGSNAPQPSAVLGLANGKVYVADTGAIDLCPINVADATLGACIPTATGANTVALAFNGSMAYLTNAGGAGVSICQVFGDGSLDACTPFSDPTFSGPSGLAIH
jgi:hypothetical protein